MDDAIGKFKCYSRVLAVAGFRIDDQQRCEAGEQANIGCG